MHRNAVKLILMSFSGGENCPSSQVALLSRLGPVHILRKTFRFGGFGRLCFCALWHSSCVTHAEVTISPPFPPPCQRCMYVSMQWCNICSISLQLDILICQNNSSHLGSCCVLSYMYDMIILCEAPRWRFSLNLKVFEAQASNQACSMFILQVSSVWPHWHWLKILI